jgi:hypothetical protein
MPSGFLSSIAVCKACVHSASPDGSLTALSTYSRTFQRSNVAYRHLFHLYHGKKVIGVRCLIVREDIGASKMAAAILCITQSLWLLDRDHCEERLEGGGIM